MKLLLGKENRLGLFYRERKNSPDPFSLSRAFAFLEARVWIRQRRFFF
jgi:hypothetical protein